MKIGVVLPQTESSPDPGALRAFTEATEAAGYDHISTYEHVLGANPEREGGWRGPYTHRHLFHEPMVMFGFMAAWTERIELVTGVLVLPQRQTALVAKQAAEIAILSRGRLRLGVGLGWNEVEYQALNEDFHTRGRRLEEQVELLRRLWGEELVTFDGRWHHVPDAGLNPLPPASIPIWLGGYADAAVRRAARIADGWILSLPLDRAPEALERVRSWVAEAGRDPAAFGLDARIGLDQGIDAAVEQGRRWQELGVSHLSVNPMACGFSWPWGHVDALRQFRAAWG
jgi:probable F420-dependent oxidoreductase